MPKSREGYLWTAAESTNGLATDAVVSSSAKIRSTYDTVIIGAGFAGLLAARELSRHHGLTVLIVEGRDRIGGRTWTARALGEEFEMGGTWVHWNQPHVYHELCRYQLHKNLKTSAGTLAAQNTYHRSADAAVTGIDGIEYGAIVQSVCDKFFEIDGLSSRDLMPYPHDPFREPAPWKRYDYLTVRQRLDQLDHLPSHKDLFETTVNSFGSAPGKDIGFVEALRWYALGGHNMAQVFELAGVYKLGKGGMTSFARSLLNEAKCDIVLDTVVSEIIQTSSGATVRSQNGLTLHAKTIISTIPLNCLGDVKFSPPLSPLKREAIAHGHINKGAKIHFKLAQTEPGWFAMCSGYGDSPFCFAFSDHNGTTTRTQSSQSEPGRSEGTGTFCIAFGYNGHLSDPHDSQHIIAQFRKNIRPGADVQAYLTHDWMNDPLAKGVWSCWSSGAMSRYLQELQKPHGSIYFASADWADGWRGFVDGALESGLRAARDVAGRLVDSNLEANAQPKL